MREKWKVEDILGLTYVCAWSVSMYAPVITNLKQRSSSAVSRDFVMLNITGYFYLLASLVLQLYMWIPISTTLPEDRTIPVDLKPKVSSFDFWYCFHGFMMNLVLVSQVVSGVKLWNFKTDNHQNRMKPCYYRFLVISLLVFAILTLKFSYENSHNGWDNVRTLSYCNALFVLKISMSLIKYIPQALHNYERKSMKGFSIQSVALDITGGIASLLQLMVQISRDQGFSYMAIVANFGKIGLALVTLVFNFIFVSQWLVFRELPNIKSEII